MLELMEKVLARLEAGSLNRREALLQITSLALAIGGISDQATAQSSDSPTFRTIGLNHLALRVTDVAATRDFYQKHLGLSIVRDNSPHNCFMASGDNYIGLFQSTNPQMDHYCYTIEDYHPEAVIEKLKFLGIDSRREENRVYFRDPSGLKLQLSGKWDSWPGKPPSDR